MWGLLKQASPPARPRLAVVGMRRCTPRCGGTVEITCCLRARAPVRWLAELTVWHAEPAARVKAAPGTRVRRAASRGQGLVDPAQRAPRWPSRAAVSTRCTSTDTNHGRSGWSGASEAFAPSARRRPARPRACTCRASRWLPPAAAAQLVQSRRRRQVPQQRISLTPAAAGDVARPEATGCPQVQRHAPQVARRLTAKPDRHPHRRSCRSA